MVQIYEYMIHDETLEAIQDYIHISSRTSYINYKFYMCFFKIRIKPSATRHSMDR